jgi:hypothetical protein
MTTAVKIHTLTITPMGILVVFRDNLWQFRVSALMGQSTGTRTTTTRLKRLKG